LVFSIAALDLLVDILLHLALEDACTGGLVEAGGLEDVCGIDPVVLATAHHMLFAVEAKLELVDRDLDRRQRVS